MANELQQEEISIESQMRAKAVKTCPNSMWHKTRFGVAEDDMRAYIFNVFYLNTVYLRWD